MADISGLRERVRDWAERTMVDALDRTYQDTVRAAPVSTGYLVTTIDTTSPLEGANVWTAEISVGASYAGYTDAGTSAHLIVAGPGKVLAFYWDKVGKDVFFRFVNHPGTRGTQWFNSGEDGGDPMATRWHDNLQAAADANA